MEPDWKSGPTYREPTASDHAIDIQPIDPIDIDGIGVDEAEQLDGEPLCATQEMFTCTRDNCDEGEIRRHVYAIDDVDTVLRDFIETVVEYGDEWLMDNCVVVDYSEAPVIGFDTSSIDEMGVDTAGYVTARFSDVEPAAGACYGDVEPMGYEEF